MALDWLSYRLQQITCFLRDVVKKFWQNLTKSCQSPSPTPCERKHHAVRLHPLFSQENKLVKIPIRIKWKNCGMLIKASSKQWERGQHSCLWNFRPVKEPWTAQRPQAWRYQLSSYIQHASSLLLYFQELSLSCCTIEFCSVSRLFCPAILNPTPSQRNFWEGKELENYQKIIDCCLTQHHSHKQQDIYWTLMSHYI